MFTNVHNVHIPLWRSRGMTKTAVPAIGAIPTTYHGIRFRSRLEARWAVLFDKAGWAWEHEPEGYTDGATKYLPDFWLPEKECFWEVKPDVSALAEGVLDRALEKAMMLVEVTGKPCCVAFGFPQPYGKESGMLLTIDGDGDEVLRWSELGEGFADAAAEARRYQFWTP